MSTINEIAKKLGLSNATVSRALNNKKGVRPEVREEILRVAKQMDYFPNSVARALVQKKAGAIGIMIPRANEFAFQNPFYSHMLLGLGTVATRHNYRLTLSINERKSYVAMFQQRVVDGIVVVANRIDDERIAELAEKKVPSVVVPGFPQDSKIKIASINSENVKSVYRAVSYLISLGHHKIAFILGSMNSLYTIERLSGYKAAFRDHHLQYDQKYIVESDFTKMEGFRLMGQLLDLPDPPSSIICIGDMVTLGVLKQINHRGIKIPADISVVAIGCSDFYELFEPPLTTIKSPVVQIGQMAAELVINYLEHGSCRDEQVLIPSEFIIRESTGPYRERPARTSHTASPKAEAKNPGSKTNNGEKE